MGCGALPVTCVYGHDCGQIVTCCHPVVNVPARQISLLRGLGIGRTTVGDER